MIQRVQSIFLLIAVILMIGVFFFPLWQKVDIGSAEVATIDAFKMKYEQFEEKESERILIAEKDVFYIALLALLSGGVALFSIFQYKNRLRQIQLGALNSMLIAALMFTAVFFILKAENLLAQDQQGTYLVGFYLPIGALLCNYLANRFIRRDEKLVRSADRIR